MRASSIAVLAIVVIGAAVLVAVFFRQQSGSPWGGGQTPSGTAKPERPARAEPTPRPAEQPAAPIEEKAPTVEEPKPPQEAPPEPIEPEPETGIRWKKRWVYISNNLYVNENVPKIEEILRRAARVGYNGVLFADYKTFTWWDLGAADRWKKNAETLRRTTRELGLELNICVFPFGYAGSLLWHDPNLASGMPVKDAPLVARGGILAPEQTAAIRNGSFEEHKDNRALRYNFQDNPGESSFIDDKIVKHGSVSLRFEDVGKVNQHGHGRVNQEIDVKPWQQYRLRAWMKCENLTADDVKLLVLAGGRTLQWQALGVMQGNRFQHMQSFRNVTTDWIEQSVTFNSLDNTKVRLYLGMWGGKTGKIWWDDFRIDSVPTFNVLRRERLPLAVAGEDGTGYEEGRDFEKIVDPLMGTKPWPGSFDTRHEPPEIKLTANSRIKEGQRVLLSCYHPALVYSGQINCSMDDPRVFELCRLQMQKTKEALAPDGFFMSHDEIRCAGWEPEQIKRFKTSGELFAHNIRKCYEIAHTEGGGKPVYVWSDMYDPNHNAHADFYLVNNTIEGSWKGLDSDVIVMKWGGGKIARPGLEFFSKRGNKQMIAAYYDGNVKSNYDMWINAAEGIPNIIGTMYTTWGQNYGNMEEFADIWWGGADVNGKR